MQQEDFILKMIERFSLFIKKLLKINIDLESEAFEQQANDLLHEFFDTDIDNPDIIPRGKLNSLMQRENLQKPIIILFLKIAILKSENEFVTGKKYYKIVNQELLPHLKAVNAFESEEDITVKNLLSQCRELYR